MLICPEASNAQNIIAAVSADGSTVWVLIRRLNSSCNRSIALVVRRLRHWLGGMRAKLNKRSPASSRLSATARCLTGSFEVRFADGRESKFFYFDDVLARRLRPDILTSDQALEAAKVLVRAERDATD